MSRREAWLSALLVLGVALAVRAVAASLIGFPKPEDTAYYVGVARNLVEGRGLVSDALWSYATPPLEFPRPAFEVWLPLPALLAAIPVALLGGPAPIPLETALRLSQLASVALGAVAAVLAWRLAADVAEARQLPTGRARSLALGTGLAAAVYLPLVLHSALPDSTMPFTVLALGACLLMTRVLRDPGRASPTDPRLLGIGVLLGLAALTRNEAAWLALAWLVLVLALPSDRLRLPGAFGGRAVAARVRLVGVVAVVSLAVFAPWAARDWLVFGTPMPGQAISNALSVTGFDIFAWNDPPTLARHLALGPTRLAELRIEGLWHNLGSVLLFLGFPASLIGLAGLPWQARDAALRSLVLLAGLTFLVTSLLFPVATTWGTFLHAAGPVHVLLLVSALGVLDALIVRVGRWRRWHRPVAWLGPALAVSASAAFSAVILPSFGTGATETQRTYQALAERMAAVGAPLGPDGPPVIHDFPIWLAETARARALALPDEPPADVLELAETFGAEWLLVAKKEHGRWPAVLDGEADPAARCFREIDLGASADPALADALADMRAFRIGCPATTMARP